MGMRRAVLDMVLIFANNPILTINLQKIIINYKFLCYSKEENKKRDFFYEKEINLWGTWSLITK